MQNPDGTLSVRPPETVQNAFHMKQPLTTLPGIGHWEINCGNASTQAPYSFNSAISLEDLPNQCKISMNVTFKENTRSCGLMLRTNERFDNAYYYKLEPNRNRIVFQSAIMHNEGGGKVLPYEVELERPIELLPDQSYKITVFVDGSVCEIYVNDQIAMSTRIYDITNGKLGLFVAEGAARFDDIKIHCLEG
ncbi:hypothetical protein D3C81_1654650 [compost metagenome]